MIFLDSAMNFLTTVRTALCLFSPFASSSSASFLNSLRLSATIELRTYVALAPFAEEPTARNSNRFPVNANGDVLLRSVLSWTISGMELTIWMEALLASASEKSVIFRMLSNILDSVEPEKMDITAGGAS